MKDMKLISFSKLLHKIKKLPSFQYQLMIWACTGTISYWKGAWAVIDRKCPTFFVLCISKFLVLFFMQAQMEDATGKNPLQLYRSLSQLRKQPAFQRGDLRFVVISNLVFSFARHAGAGHPTYLVVLNFGRALSLNDHSVILKDSVYKKGIVVLSSSNMNINVGSKVDLTNLKIAAGQGLVIKVER